MKSDKLHFRTYLVMCLVIMHCIWTPLAKSQLDAGQISEFLELLTSDWKGTAVQTPVGPVEYNIIFVKNPDAHITGAAYLNRSTHYWDFYRKAGQLNLNFLSTFAGNDEPIKFISHQYSEDGLEFNSLSRNDVKVIINPDQTNLVIRIFLDDKAHVKISMKKQTE